MKGGEIAFFTGVTFALLGICYVAYRTSDTVHNSKSQNQSVHQSGSEGTGTGREGTGTGSEGTETGSEGTGSEGTEAGSEGTGTGSEGAGTGSEVN